MRRWRLLAAGAATVAVVGPIGYLWQDSLLPETYSAMSMGHADGGGGPAHGAHGGGRPVSEFTVAAGRRADVSMTLVTRLDKGRYTVNGTTPGPPVLAAKGQLVEVRLVNENVPGGVTLHWHGVDVPGAMDGVAGVTQDAVRPGQSFVYRFVADRAGTYWYHSHQISHEQVIKGLFGAVVIGGGPTDVTALIHLYSGGRHTVNGVAADLPVTAAAGAKVRVRIVNTDSGPTYAWTGAPYRLLAIDGTDVREPTLIAGKSVQITAGGRADLEVVAPARIQLGGSPAIVLGSGAAPIPKPPATLDPLTYGTPAPAPAVSANRTFRYDIGRRLGFVDGRPGNWWTVNGHMLPDVPMFEVSAGDVVRMRISNDSGEVHPMHLHGHHMLVLARDGVAATGSPWWTDSLNVADHETYEVMLVADNPGIWSDHCHNLKHAKEGLVVHLMYEGVATPYVMGGVNEPE
ncbi:multicopper oxidase family protein [Paractinoplanes lichenicola]|uniref:Multicopper oxidase family protein n=1 Tax=Paractinoplanes lichenicola TaxID=2802976 RepID=A0ABS1VEF9_9ACTN|nr:multicopper oxidase family protein [Actinoplanes lichenicola]MBL7253072.1 multicopper oxidase family protein [Actinoplanes lichenicola]